MIPFTAQPAKAVTSCYDRSGETTVRVMSTEPVNVMVFEMGRYGAGPAIHQSRGLKCHEFTFKAPSIRWDLVIENQGQHVAGGAYTVTYMARVATERWGFW